MNLVELSSFGQNSRRHKNWATQNFEASVEKKIGINFLSSKFVLGENFGFGSASIEIFGHVRSFLNAPRLLFDSTFSLST